MKSFRSSARISANADTVWKLLTDAPAYPTWNSTVVSVEGSIALGEKVTVRPKINPGRAFPVKVTTFEAPKRMVWTGGMPLGLFKGERTFTVEPAGDAVEFTMEEIYSGLLAGMITRSIPDLQPAFDEFAASLRKAAEG